MKIFPYIFIVSIWFQVVTLVHTLLTSRSLRFKTCLVVCPLNTVLNWMNEWEKWLDKKDRLDVSPWTLLHAKFILGNIKHIYIFCDLFGNVNISSQHTIEIFLHSWKWISCRHMRWQVVKTTRSERSFYPSGRRRVASWSWATSCSGY